MVGFGKAGSFMQGQLACGLDYKYIPIYTNSMG